MLLMLCFGCRSAWTWAFQVVSNGSEIAADVEIRRSRTETWIEVSAVAGFVLALTLL